LFRSVWCGWRPQHAGERDLLSRGTGGGLFGTKRPYPGLAVAVRAGLAVFWVQWVLLAGGLQGVADKMPGATESTGIVETFGAEQVRQGLLIGLAFQALQQFGLGQGQVVLAQGALFGHQYPANLLPATGGQRQAVFGQRVLLAPNSPRQDELVHQEGVFQLRIFTGFFGTQFQQMARRVDACLLVPHLVKMIFNAQAANAPVSQILKGVCLAIAGSPLIVAEWPLRWG